MDIKLRSQEEISFAKDMYIYSYKENLPDPVLFKFLDFTGAFLSIENSNARFTYACDFNDMQEGIIPPFLKNVIPDIVKYSLVYCLTQSYDNVLMWTHYADSWNGAVIGFSIKDKKKFRRFEPTKVTYYSDVSEKENAIDNFIRSQINSDTQKPSEHSLIAEILKFKNSIWEYEKEIRLIRYPHQCLQKKIITSLDMVKFINSKERDIARFFSFEELGLEISAIYLGTRLLSKIFSIVDQLYISEQLSKEQIDYLKFYISILKIPNVKIYCCSSSTDGASVEKKDIFG